MRVIWLDAVLLGSLLLSNPAGGAQDDGRFVRAVYLTEWSIRNENISIVNLNGDLLTHIYYAFASLNQNGSLQFSYDSDHGHFQQLRQLKHAYPHLQTVNAAIRISFY
jgi:GH18 family chitinase